MLGKSKYRVAAVLFLLIFVLSGCGLFGPEENVTSQPIDPPPLQEQEASEVNIDISQTDGTTVISNEELQITQQVIYLKDMNGYIVPQTMSIPKVEGIGKQVLRYMVKGGPVESILPEGFEAVLPEGTQVLGMSVKEDGLAIVDFSKEFLNYQPDEEKAILDAITWSLTEFPTINRVTIWVEGRELEVMPVTKTPVHSLSRANGINLELAENIDIGQTTPVTLYFQADTPSGDGTYYVPVTRLIPRSTDIVRDSLNQLIMGPKEGSNLFSGILPSTKLLSAVLDNNVAIANFDQTILSFDSGKASDDVIKSIVLTLTENTEADKVLVEVNGESTVTTDSSDFSKPVTRPQWINPASS
ncbi:GerMN domain-containing protein [Microaerobacter geothermalis]|uniref:GerMN domain-containing protein n=1 Tax=Microaerobacter geothermalis TaxID=674972 RepID=UPI001F1801B2|nr:GerMN domain-containing protein [Microaerobacter geothermalis]MCF6092629.1 GerMN domain-containing protein [Microaerobacter geothermalis]